MGQSNSSLDSLNPEGYEKVCLSPEGYNPRFGTVPFPFHKKPTNLRNDDALWTEFGKAIDQELPKLDDKYCQVVLGVILSLILLAFLVRLTDPPEDAVWPYVCLIMIGLGAKFWIFSRHRQVDEAIAGICAKYKDRFQEHGIIPEYRTRFTGFFKPKHARPRRILVFRPNPYNGP